MPSICNGLVTSTHQWVVSWGKQGVASLLHLVTSFDPALYSSWSLESWSSRDLDPADDQRVLGWRAKRVGALRPPCHQSNFFWRLFSQLAFLSCRFGMIEPDHGTGCEHQPIEFRRVSRMQKLAVLRILGTKERACQIILPPLPSALSTRWCNSCSYIWDAVAEAQFFVRVLLYINSIYNYTDVDRPPGIERYWKPCSLLKSMKLIKVFDIVRWLGRNRAAILCANQRERYTYIYIYICSIYIYGTYPTILRPNLVQLGCHGLRLSPRLFKTC